jgi:hypothetical protein
LSKDSFDAMCNIMQDACVLDILLNQAWPFFSWLQKERHVCELRADFEVTESYLAVDSRLLYYLPNACPLHMQLLLLLASSHKVSTNTSISSSNFSRFCHSPDPKVAHRFAWDKKQKATLLGMEASEHSKSSAPNRVTSLSPLTSVGKE